MKEGVARALIVVVVSKETSARYCGLEGGEEACGVGTAAPAVVDFDDTDAGPVRERPVTHFPGALVHTVPRLGYLTKPKDKNNRNFPRHFFGNPPRRRVSGPLRPGPPPPAAPAERPAPPPPPWMPCPRANRTR